MRSIRILMLFQRWAANNYLPDRSKLLWIYLFTIWINKCRDSVVLVDEDVLLKHFKTERKDLESRFDDLKETELISFWKEGTEIEVVMNSNPFMEYLEDHEKTKESNKKPYKNF